FGFPSRSRDFACFALIRVKDFDVPAGTGFAFRVQGFWLERLLAFSCWPQAALLATTTGVVRGISR
ncbi:MAG TPA: hypothetical protein PLI34_18895, partial [Saprospiraceae bacterium]|nr:hypothetical protein [Saprospiraceae bacterium]